MRKTGFALIEVIVVVVVLVGLFALILSLLDHTRARTLSVQCQSNLRQIGRIMHVYAAENNGEIGLLGYYGYPGSSVTWLDFLTGSVHNYRKVSRGSRNVWLEDTSISLCPAENPFYNPLPGSNSVHGYIYGSLYRQNDDPASISISKDLSEPRDLPAAMTKVVSMPRMQRPSDHLFLADSYTLSGLNSKHTQLYLIDPDSRNRGVHLRHNARANGLFADGHVELMDGVRMKNLPYTRIQAGFIQQGERIQF